jgi:hypothetical protein
MRRFTLWLLVTLPAVGCAQPAEPNVPAATGSPTFAVDPAERTVVVRFDETATFFDDCFGEFVLVEFHRQLVTFFRGEITHGHLLFNVINLSSTVTGLTSGTVWTLHGTEITAANGDFTAPETPGEATILLNHTLISPGTAVNLRLRERVHITIAPDETVTVERSTFEAVCR